MVMVSLWSNISPQMLGFRILVLSLGIRIWTWPLMERMASSRGADREMLMRRGGTIRARRGQSRQCQGQSYLGLRMQAWPLVKEGLSAEVWARMCSLGEGKQLF